MKKIKKSKRIKLIPYIQPPRRKKLQSTAVYNKKTARQFMKMDYYISQNTYMKKYELIQSEKARLSTPKSDRITELLEFYKSIGTDISTMGTTLLGLYEKNKEAALNGKAVLNTRLINLVAKPELLLMAYRQIRGNKGALTPGDTKTNAEINAMTPEQREIYLKSNIFPDGFSIQDVILVSRLIRKGKYPWGISSRIYIEKPGVQNKKRPITIPPFLDRVVQKAIELVLQSIYEPHFELLNRSFGFRPNKGVHDAIVAITGRKTNGMRIAIEGDVEAAYDTVNKEKLLSILNKRVHDKKFLRLISERLDYEYIEKETRNRFKPELGIPQGGIDSPYMFNIYMHELDEYVCKNIQEIFDKRNALIKNPNSRNPPYVRIKNLIHRYRPHLGKMKLLLKDPNADHEMLRNELFTKIKTIRLLRHKTRHMRSVNRTKTIVRTFYVRYADDWILLTNGSHDDAERIKKLISDFLQNELKLKLSEKKTLITDITKESAHFLGYEVRGKAFGRLRKVPLTDETEKRIYRPTVRASGLTLWTSPDTQRLITRLHMKGYCKKDGFPISIPMLTIVEPQVIVERFNAAIRGLANYYMGYIRNQYKINRWIYILRYSCIKTLAHKYRCSCSKIFDRFGINMDNISTRTISIPVEIKVGEKTYTKKWNLLTNKDLREIAKKVSQKAFRTNEKKFWDIELRQEIGEYPLKKGKVPKVTNEDYLEAISWVNVRTQASFGMPCSNCVTIKYKCTTSNTSEKERTL